MHVYQLGEMFFQGKLGSFVETVTNSIEYSRGIALIANASLIISKDTGSKPV